MITLMHTKKLDATRLRIKDSWLMENINSNGLHVADPILKPFNGKIKIIGVLRAK